MVNFSKDFQSIAALRPQEKGGSLVGIISQLRFGDHVLAPDLEIPDPAGGDGRILVVALLTSLEWNLCADGKIVVRGFLSEANGQPTQLVYYTSQEPFEVEIQLAIYAYDGVAQKQYRQFFTGSAPLCMKVAKEAEDESSNDLCFCTWSGDEEVCAQFGRPVSGFDIRLAPPAEPHVLELAVSSQHSFVRNWGVAPEPPATSEESPAVVEESPAVGEESPAVGEESPAMSEEPPVTEEMVAEPVSAEEDLRSLVTRATRTLGEVEEKDASTIVRVGGERVDIDVLADDEGLLLGALGCPSRNIEQAHQVLVRAGTVAWVRQDLSTYSQYPKIQVRLPGRGLRADLLREVIVEMARLAGSSISARPAPHTAPSAPELAPLLQAATEQLGCTYCGEGDSFQVKVRSDQEEITVEVVVKDDAVVIKGVAGEVGPHFDPLWILRLSRAFEQTRIFLSDEKRLQTEVWLVRRGLAVESLAKALQEVAAATRILLEELG